MPSDVRVTDLWHDVVKPRLDSALMQTILGGAGRVYVEGDDYSEPEGAENQPWGRLVIVPATTLWEAVDDPSTVQPLAFLIRTEANNYTGSNYRVGVTLEAAQAEAYNRLNRWTPTGLRHALIAIPFYRWSRPQSLPLWDESRGLWFLSSQWRTQVTNKP